VRKTLSSGWGLLHPLQKKNRRRTGGACSTRFKRKTADMRMGLAPPDLKKTAAVRVGLAPPASKEKPPT